jgi:hypothetical protein
VSELVVPLVLLALLLVVGAAGLVVALRRRRPRVSARPPATAPRRTSRLRADRGTELARPEQLGIRTLAPAERQRYLAAWEGALRRAEQSPAVGLSEADAVVERALRDCGYPVDDPRAPGDVVPGRHADVLASFRAGRAVEQVTTSAHADPVQVQQGIAHLRAAFDAVVADGTPAFPEAPRVLSAEPGGTPRPQPGR